MTINVTRISRLVYAGRTPKWIYEGTGLGQCCRLL